MHSKFPAIFIVNCNRFLISSLETVNNFKWPIIVERLFIYSFFYQATFCKIANQALGKKYFSSRPSCLLSNNCKPIASFVAGGSQNRVTQQYVKFDTENSMPSDAYNDVLKTMKFIISELERFNALSQLNDGDIRDIQVGDCWLNSFLNQAVQGSSVVIFTFNCQTCCRQVFSSKPINWLVG